MSFSEQINAFVANYVTEFCKIDGTSNPHVADFHRKRYTPLREVAQEVGTSRSVGGVRTTRATDSGWYLTKETNVSFSASLIFVRNKTSSIKRNQGHSTPQVSRGLHWVSSLLETCGRTCRSLLEHVYATSTLKLLQNVDSNFASFRHGQQSREQWPLLIHHSACHALV